MRAINLTSIVMLWISYWFLGMGHASSTAVNEATHSQENASYHSSKAYTLGVLSFRDKATTQARWQPLINYLQQRLPNTPIRLSVYFYDELDAAVKEKTVDFILTQPSHYVLLTYRNQLSSPLASLINLEGDFATDQFGGVIFTRANNDQINDLKQLDGKRIATSDKSSLGSYQMQALELLELGIDISQSANILETGQPQSLAVDWVLTGKADVGFVRTGVLEQIAQKGALEWHRIKLIGAQKIGDFPFLTSTRLYPEWPVAAMPHVDKLISAQVASALLAIPQNSPLTQSMGIAGFAVSGDYRVVDNLMRQLRIEPFNETPTLTVADIYHQWSAEITFIALFISLVLVAFVTLLYRRNLTLINAKQHIQRTSEQLRKLELAVQQSPESILITDLDGTITYTNPAVEKITGYRQDELLNHNPRIFQSTKTDKRLYQELWYILTQGRIWQGEIINRHKSGEDYHAHMIIAPVKNEYGKTTAYLSIQRDITEQKRDEQRIHQLLYVDSLTGLGNRNQLIDNLDKCLQQPTEGILGFLLLINIDRFKWINTTHGVGCGDQILMALAERLMHFMGDSGIVVRLESDKFALLLNTSDHWQKDDNWLLGWQAALQSLVHAPFKLNDTRISLNASMGITQVIKEPNVDSVNTINKIIAQANTALKLAQKQGGNRFETFTEMMAERDLEKHNTELALTHALSHNQLKLFLQDQVDEQGQLVGAEALIRWQHPDKGLLSPAAFISIAEDSDLIVKIGYWVLNEACRLLQPIAQQPLTLSINISPRHFLQSDFVEKTLAIVEFHQVNPNSMVLEITESLFMENLDEVSEKMKQLKAMGFSFAIDDFGTGYSSLSYLKYLPVDELKIDRAFVSAMSEEGLSKSLVETIYVVAKKLNLRVVAEGVETSEQAAMLHQLPGIIQQGYLHNKPQNGDDWLTQKQAKNVK